MELENVEYINGWEKYQKLVLTKLDEHNDKLQNLDEHMIKIYSVLAALKVKAGVWGIIGGSIPILILLVYHLIAKK